MSRILLTAAGSMSALPAMERYRAMGHEVFACDIYDRSWNAASTLADGFFQSRLATDGESYVAQMLEEVKRLQIHYLIPLTDPEVDVLSGRKADFAALGCTLCTPEKDVATLLRSKDEMNRFLEKNLDVSAGCCFIPTWKASGDTLPPFDFPVILKPSSGRSSQGLVVARDQQAYLAAAALRDDYIVQPFLEGEVWCADVARDAAGNVYSLARREILRTTNGLGTTVEVVPGHALEKTCACIAEAANIVGVVNMEFICHNGAFYFLEVNPRFSGGVGFSMAAGADFAAAMLLCHRGECLPGNQSAKKCILARESRITITRA